MNDFLLIVHFIGLMMGAAGGMGSMIVGRAALKASPEGAGALRALGPRLAKLSAAGIILMWITGVIMVWSVYGGLDNLPGAFWIKFIFVLTLSAAAIVIELAYAQMKAGNRAAAARLPMAGPVAGLSAFLAVIFAVIAFH
jgi:hypothetical protein